MRPAQGGCGPGYTSSVTRGDCFHDVGDADPAVLLRWTPAGSTRRHVA